MSEKSTSLRSGFSKLEIAVVIGVVLILATLILPAIQRAREAAWQTQSSNNLRQLALAFHNYHDVYSVLPPGGTIMADGHGHHGWFARLCPYLEVTPYNAMIDFDRQWNDRINQHLFQITPMFALRPGASPVTTQEGFVVTHYSGNPWVLHRNSSVRFDDFEHGTNHGWVLGDIVGDFEPWGSPFNWRPAAKPLNISNNSYGGWSGGAHFVMGDGSVRFVSEEIKESVSVSFNGGLPTPTPEQRERPDHKWTYRKGNTDITIEHIPLDELEWDGLALEVFYEQEGAPRTALIRPRGKWSDHTPTTCDLRLVLETCPDVQVLLADVPINEETSRLFVQFPRLGLIRTPSVNMTPEVIENLKRMVSLEELIVGHFDRDVLPELRSQLPGIKIDVKGSP